MKPKKPAGQQPAPEPAVRPQQRLEFDADTRQRYHTVTETCHRLRVPPHVLRYWEKEFDISLKRNSAGRRIISDPQLRKLEIIRQLLQVEKLTIPGARRRLEKLPSRPPELGAGRDQRELLRWVQRELLGLRAVLEPAPDSAQAQAPPEGGA